MDVIHLQKGMKLEPLTTDQMANRPRTTYITLHLKTYGTDAQRLATVEKVREELELQGFDFTLLVINSD